MLVVEGKRGKLQHVRNIIQNKYTGRRVLVIDASEKSKKWDISRKCSAWMAQRSEFTSQNIQKTIEREKDYLSMFDCVVLFIGANIKDIPIIKELKEAIGTEVILTVKSNSEVLTYEY